MEIPQQLPPHLQALKDQAEQLVSAEQVDEEALLQKYIAEARARRDAQLKQAAEEALQAEANREGRGPAVHQGFPRKYVELMVFKGSGKHDLSYVVPSVNGYAMKIQRGVKVIVPSVFANALNDAVQDIAVKTEGGVVTEPTHRFPFQVIREVSEAEYLAFADSQRKVRPAPVPAEQSATPAVQRV